VPVVGELLAGGEWTKIAARFPAVKVS